MSLFFNIGAILFMTSSIFACSSFGYQSPRYVILAHEITAKTGRELQVEKQLYLVGTGGRMMHDIQMMQMSFDYYQEVSVTSARELVLYSAKKYLSAVNSNSEIQPFLHDCPFTAKNIEILIFFYDHEGRELPLEKIGCVECAHGELSYYNRLSFREAIHEESYEEALQAAAVEQ